MKAAFYTLGCKVNQYETEYMAELLRNAGFEIVKENEEADYYIVNSCTVTATADQKTRKSIRKFKRNHPNSTVILTGCMPQAFPKEAKELIEADIVFSNKNDGDILSLINEYNLTPDLVVYAYEYSKEQKNGNPKPLIYVESVLRNWYDANIISVEDAKNSFTARKDRYSIYRSVLNQLGFSNRQPTDSEKEIIDIWIDKYNFSPELISYACSKSINTPTPSISYINGIIENWYSKDITTLEDVKKEEEEFRANKQKEITKTKTETKNHNYNNNYNKDRTPKVVTRYHNSFNEHFRKYSEDELEAKLLRVQNSKKAK